MSEPAPAGDAAPLVERALVRAHFALAMFWMLVVMSIGLVISLHLNQVRLFDGIAWLSYGRLRFIHTNAVAYAFLGNGFLGALYYCVPRLTGRRVASARAGWVLLVLWQITLLFAFAGESLGFAQGVEWGETPSGFEPGTWNLVYVPVDFLIELGAVAFALQFLFPIARAMDARLYVSLWYFSASLVWLVLTYVMGNTLPEWTLSGTSGAATAGLFIHDLIGLFITPLGWGLMYFFVPVILRRPIWSHALSVIGFWALAFFYPLNGVHHFLFSSIPMSVQRGAILSTIAVELVVTTVIVNFFGTVWGRTHELMMRSLPLRWFYTGMVLYFVTCVQCAFQATLPFQEVIHFTDWVVGHAHLVMLGVFSFWVLGVITWLWPRLTGREWISRRVNHWHYWLSTLGIGIMFLDLTIAGVVHGWMQKDLAPWMDIVRALGPFWWVRTFAGAMILTGQILFCWNLFASSRRGAPYDPRVDLLEPAVEAR